MWPASAVTGYESFDFNPKRNRAERVQKVNGGVARARLVAVSGTSLRPACGKAPARGSGQGVRPAAGNFRASTAGHVCDIDARQLREQRAFGVGQQRAHQFVDERRTWQVCPVRLVRSAGRPQDLFGTDSVLLAGARSRRAAREPL